MALLVLLAGLVAGQLLRPTPEPTLRLTLPTAQHTFGGAAPSLPWPQYGQATLYVEGIGSMGSSGGQTPIPTASVAKVMTAYVFLRNHPLQPGEQGPTFRISPQEAAQLPARKQRGESLVEVVAGQQFTERKALEALMIVSANNIAHELARWDSGDEQTFVRKMNETARSLGMNSTTYTDPSGYDSRTVSTAADQVKLLTAAMKIPAFAEIVANRTYVPNDGRPARAGGNILVGRHGVLGGKTGYTDAAGGNFVFAARKQVGNVPTTIVGAVMGQRTPSAMGAISVAQRLVIAAENALTSVTLAPAGAQVAVVDDGLGGETPLRAATPVTVVGWPGLTVPVRVTGDPPRRAADGTRVGTVTAGAASTGLTVSGELKEPSILKRLLRLK
ncbi:D-alanyl-D-alanine carboxypeptidase family protein [Actinomadura keratinilytica]|uniref:D-alanyl-D-alanine carboxypeptidase family protein n=1 Tax=Actinomadura keratinilytica TaxID=547461 RepID=UPI003606BC82